MTPIGPPSSSPELLPPELLPPEVLLPGVLLPEGAPPLPALGAWDPHATITTATPSETIPDRGPTTGPRALSADRGSVALTVFMAFFHAS